LFAASVAFLIVACIAGWAVSGTQARVAMPATIQPSVENDDKRKTVALGALRRLFIHIQLSHATTVS
jgi:hypothetical protein